MTAGNEAGVKGGLTRHTRSACVSSSSIQRPNLLQRFWSRQCLGALKRVNDKLPDQLWLRREHPASARLVGEKTFHWTNRRPVQFSTVGLDADPIIDGVLKALLAAKIFLGRLNRDVT
jgi:hypothetical protein